MKLNRKVLVYDSPGVSKSFNLQLLLGRHILSDTYIARQVVTAQTLQHSMDDNTCLFILPGAKASSTYREELSGKNLDHVKKHMRRGMKVLGFCAGAYVFSSEFDFTFYNEWNGNVLERKHISSALGVVDAKAYGPDLRLYDPAGADGSLNLYKAATLNFNGISTKALICKAPSFSAYNPKQCEPISTYEATGEVAILRFQDDRIGSGILCGPSLEVGGEDLDYYVPVSMRNPQVQKTVGELNATRHTRSKLVAQVFTELLPSDVAPIILRNLKLVPRVSISGTPTLI